MSFCGLLEEAQESVSASGRKRKSVFSVGGDSRRPSGLENRKLARSVGGSTSTIPPLRFSDLRRNV
jgi:hypothetical protein